MFGTNVEFLELAERVDLLPVEPNPRGGCTSSWKISNKYMPISEMRHLVHYYKSSFACMHAGENNAREGIRLVTI